MWKESEIECYCISSSQRLLKSISDTALSYLYYLYGCGGAELMFDELVTFESLCIT